MATDVPILQISESTGRALGAAEWGRARAVSGAILPTFGVARAVKDRDDDDHVVVNDEEHLVGESPCQRASRVSMHRGVLEWVSEDGVYGRIDGHKEILTHAWYALLVPVEGLLEVCFCLRPDDQPVSHLRRAILSRTTGQGEPAVGSW